MLPPSDFPPLPNHEPHPPAPHLPCPMSLLLFQDAWELLGKNKPQNQVDLTCYIFMIYNLSLALPAAQQSLLSPYLVPNSDYKKSSLLVPSSISTPHIQQMTLPQSSSEILGYLVLTSSGLWSNTLSNAALSFLLPLAREEEISLPLAEANHSICTLFPYPPTYSKALLQQSSPLLCSSSISSLTFATSHPVIAKGTSLSSFNLRGEPRACRSPLLPSHLPLDMRRRYWNSSHIWDQCLAEVDKICHCLYSFCTKTTDTGRGLLLNQQPSTKTHVNETPKKRGKLEQIQLSFLLTW